ncbi:uncharacterized protein LOC141720428 isoform X2 [Apium graveolens]
MSAQLKDLSAKLRRIGGMTSLDAGKKKVGEGDDAARKAAPSRPGRTTIVINEPRAEDMQQGDVIRVPAPRKRKSAPAGSGDKGNDVSEGPVLKKAVVDLAPDTPETLKALLASFTPETRRRELFENYASTAERKKYRKEPLDDFLVGHQEEITAANSRVAGLVCITRRLQAKADAAEVYKTESERLSREIQALKEASAREAAAHKKILDEIRERQDRAEASVREMRAENQKLKDDLASRPTPEEVLAGFRCTPAYYEELRSRSAGMLLLSILLKSLRV